MLTDVLRLLIPQALKQVIARGNQARSQVTQMNFQAALTRFDFAIRKARALLPTLIEAYTAQSIVSTANALLTLQALEVLYPDLS